MDVSDNTDAPKDLFDKVQRFMESMSEQERMLVMLKGELYDGSWEEMLADLRARLKGDPYIFKLAHRINDDLERIARLQDFERNYGVDLSDYTKADDGIK